MNSYVKTNDRLVNLKNVSNINISYSDQRIIFNMNYSIEIVKRGDTHVISDYVYLDTRNIKDFENALNELLVNEYIIKNFIRHNDGYINMNEISSVKFSEHKNRVIFNLSHSKDFKDYKSQEILLTSEFVYVDFQDYKEFKQFERDVKNRLLGEE